MSMLRAIARPSIRKYTLLLCAGYLLVVFMFHAHLQFRMPSVAEDSEDNAVPIPQSILQKLSAPLQMTRIVKMADVLVHANIAQQASLKEETFAKGIKPEINPFAIQQKPCDGPQAQYANEFQLIIPGVYVYSGYWDDRPNDFDNEYGGVKVRFMATVSGKDYRPIIKCLWTVDGVERSTLVSYYELCENHNRRWGGFILSCEVPSEIQDHPRCSVRVAGEMKSAPRMVSRIALLQVSPVPSSYTYGLCVPPLFGNISSPRLVEFIELSLMLGVQHIMIYNFKITPVVNLTLQHYVKQGLLTVLPWVLPGIVDRAMWYHGQIVAVQDCLWRHMGRSEFVSFNDIDEFIIPHNSSRWDGVMRHIDSNTTCGFKFKSAFFNPRLMPLPPQASNIEPLPGLMTSVNQRTAMLSHVRTKCIVKPRSIFEMGIHHISKPILATLAGVNVEPLLAVLHHYRPCLMGFGMVCRDIIQDDTTLWYGPVLYTRMKKALRSILASVPPVR